MITHQTFYTYKNDFPLILNEGQSVQFPNSYNLDNIFKKLILELSDISMLTRFTYITRHTNDRIPEAILGEFIKKFPSIVSLQNEASFLGIPTVWFTCYSEKEGEVNSIIENLNKKGICYFSNGPTYHKSLDQIPPDQNYTTSVLEAKTFPKFLHQVTQIGINILVNHESSDFLKVYKSLEWRQNPNRAYLLKLQNELEVEPSHKSSFYYKNIKKNTQEKEEFWINFQKVYVKEGMIYSWPHFLFNICGV